MAESEKNIYPSKYNKYHLKNRNHNTYADDFIFVRSIVRNSLDPLVPLMAGITRADPNYFVDLRNKGFYEKRLIVMEYVVSGVGHITYNGITKKVSAGDFYLINSEFNGSYRSDPKSPYVKKWVNLNGQLVPAILKAFGIKNQVLILHVDVDKYFEKLFEILSRYDELSHFDDDLEIMHVLLDMFDEIRRVQEEQKKEVRSANIGDIVKYIDNNLLQGDLSIENLSDAFYISRRTMHRMFIKEFGIPPLKYITGKKIEMAQKMLVEDISVEEVARLLYFSNAEYFRKVFVSVSGMSPQKYKKQMQKKS
jgi:AraC-like DNA-binding protein